MKFNIQIIKLTWKLLEKIIQKINNNKHTLRKIRLNFLI